MGRKGGGKKSKGGKSLSNVKKNNLKRHKLVKAGKLKPKSSPRFVEGGHLQGKTKKKPELLKPEELEERDRVRKEEAKQWVILIIYLHLKFLKQYKIFMKDLKANVLNLFKIKFWCMLPMSIFPSYRHRLPNAPGQ